MKLWCWRGCWGRFWWQNSSSIEYQWSPCSLFYDDSIVGGGDRPLGEKLPDDFEVKTPDGYIYHLTNGLELHRLVLEDYDQLERRSKELDKKIIDAKCSFGNINEVSEPPSLPLLPRWRHCGSPATTTPPTPPSSFSASAPIPTLCRDMMMEACSPPPCGAQLPTTTLLCAGASLQVGPGSMIQV